MSTDGPTDPNESVEPDASVAPGVSGDSDGDVDSAVFDDGGEFIDPDATVPRRRPIADPLVDDPRRATGLTGQIPRPGDDRPAWLVPVLFVGFAVFIAVLAIVGLGDDRSPSASSDPDAVATSDDGRTSSDSADSAAGSSDAAPDDGASGDLGGDPASGDAASGDAVTQDGTTGDSVTDDSTAGPISIDGVGPNQIGLGEQRVPIESSCLQATPQSGEEPPVVVSSFLFTLDVGGSPVAYVLDRRFDGTTESVTRFGVDDPADAVEGNSESVGDSGAFRATFPGDGGDEVVIVNPSGDVGFGCSSLLVTNEPGQLSVSTSRVVVAACVTGDESSGRRFRVVASQRAVADIDVKPLDDAAGAGAATISLTLGEVGSTMTDDAAEAFNDADQWSFSGTVTGAASYDVTIDLQRGQLPTC